MFASLFAGALTTPLSSTTPIHQLASSNAVAGDSYDQAQALAEG